VRHCRGRRPAAAGLKIEVTINILWGGVWQGVGVGGGTVYTTVNVVMRWQVGGFGSDGGNSGCGGSNDGDNGGGNVAMLVATRTGVGQRNEVGWGEEQNLVMTVAAMLWHGGGANGATRGGGADNARRHCCYGG
jgi:hypothetical protein